MNTIAPPDVWRSEAFAEDLTDGQDDTELGRGRVRMLSSSTLLCALPAVMALLGGVVAFFHAMG